MIPKSVEIIRNEYDKHWQAFRAEAAREFTAALMPHQIRITDIKVERLQDISNEDCLREGIYKDWNECGGWTLTEFYDYPNNENDGYDTPREAFAALIDKVSGRGTWDSNPWVFAYSFELINKKKNYERKKMDL